MPVIPDDRFDELYLAMNPVMETEEARQKILSSSDEEVETILQGFRDNARRVLREAGYTAADWARAVARMGG